MKGLLLIAALATAAWLGGCNGPWNNPYPARDAGKNILYSSFSERPKHLDPVQSYAENEAVFTAQIYTPPLNTTTSSGRTNWFRWLVQTCRVLPSTMPRIGRCRRLHPAPRSLIVFTKFTSNLASNISRIRLSPRTTAVTTAITH